MEPKLIVPAEDQLAESLSDFLALRELQATHPELRFNPLCGWGRFSFILARIEGLKAPEGFSGTHPELYN
jgi:hypothetical protein